MVSDKINILKTKLPKDVVLVAVSKTKPIETILEACSKGHLDFGENKVQELVQKQENLPKNIRWHMIGHVQRNKVKYIAPFVYLIHGVDSLRLLYEINKQGKKNNKTINCLLQIHIAKEENIGRYVSMDSLGQNLHFEKEQIRLDWVLNTKNK